MQQTLATKRNVFHVWRAVPGLAGGLLAVGLLASSVAQAGTLTISGDLIQGRCDMFVDSGARLDFGAYNVQDFLTNSGTAAVKSLRLHLDNCNLPTSHTLIYTASVKVTGNVTTHSDHVFSDNPASTTGFMLRELDHTTPAWTQPLSAFYDVTKSLASGEESYQESASTMNSGSVLNYAVGYVRTDPGQAPVTPEKVTATVTFTFEYF